MNGELMAKVLIRAIRHYQFSNCKNYSKEKNCQFNHNELKGLIRKYLKFHDFCVM